jgi:nucleoside-diphosphate-sugar epimerase
VRVAAGTYRVIGAGDLFTSRVHVDDLAAAARLAALAATPAREAYNVADDLPTRSREYADAVAARLDRPPPPTADPAAVGAEAREFFSGDRRIANRRIKEELGLALRYPTWREGLEQSLAEEAVTVAPA